MAIAAVPRYVPQDFSEATPSMRFGMYLRLWGANQAGLPLPGWPTQEQRLELDKRSGQPKLRLHENKSDALRAACDIGALRPNDLGFRSAVEAVLDRQAALAAPLLAAGTLLRLEASCVAPFVTGLGNAHPLENGFAFLEPYGWPYLPGSGIKGVLRAAARELVQELEREHGWSHDEIDALFGRAAFASSGAGASSTDGATRGALTFWDALPRLPGTSLSVDVMTAHQSHYYQRAEAPHDSGNPNPVHFLTVPPGARMAFNVVCDTGRLRTAAPWLAEDGLWRGRITQAFGHAFEWLGFGAKTAVGYGAMRRDEQAEARFAAEARRDAEASAEREKRRTRTPAANAIADFERTMAEREQAMRGRRSRIGQPEFQVAQALAERARRDADWSAEERRAAAEAIERWAPRLIDLDLKDLRKRLGLAALRNG